MEFQTKDSGKRENFGGGMVRDTQTGKPRYDLCWKPLYRRWAELMGRGAEKYGANNWMKACDEEAYERFKASAERHLMQYLEGDRTEDHAAAVIFNLAGAEFVKGVLPNAKKDTGSSSGTVNNHPGLGTRIDC